MKKTIFLMLAATTTMLLLSGACDWKTDGADRLDALLPPPPDGGCCGDGGLSDIDLGDVGGTGLPGHWAVQFVQKGTITPLGPEDKWNITVTDIYIADISTDQRLATLTFCTQENQITNPNPTDLGKTVVPAALKIALAKDDAKVKIPLAGDGTFAASDVYSLWGIHGEMMTNPLTDQIPQNASDPRQWDQDEDGNAGVTIDVVNPKGNRFMARRAVWTYQSGTLSADQQWITGKLVFRIDEAAIGGSVTNVAPITPKTSGPFYQFRRVSDSFNCAELSQSWSTVFQGGPKP
jgi:hypothetical protein